jgi:WD40 repeat protein
VNSAVYSPDGKFILSASEDKTIRIWNVQMGAQIGIFYGDANIQCLDVREVRQNLLIAAGDNVGWLLFLRWLGS